MTNTLLYALWGALFALTAALGFLPETQGVLSVLRILASLLFFLPPAVLLVRAKRRGDERTRCLIRGLSLASLGITALTLVLSFLTVLAPQWVGNFLHCFLTIVSAPMMCGGVWVLSLFLWACLLISSLKKFK